MGTATVISVISEWRNYEGGLLLPGVNVSLEAMNRRTAQLPAISLQYPKALIGNHIVYDKYLLMEGLLAIYKKNQ